MDFLRWIALSLLEMQDCGAETAVGSDAECDLQDFQKKGIPRRWPQEKHAFV